MRVTTPLVDMHISIDRLVVVNGALVLTNAADDAIATRTVMGPADMRRILRAFMHPGVLWFALTCLFRPGQGAGADTGAGTGDGANATINGEHHPTPNPW